MIETVAGVLAQTIRISLPYTLTAVGASFSERSGIVNIALEGTLLVGAFAAVLATHLTGNPWAGVVAGIIAGLLAAWLHAVVSVTFRADQIISGVAINLLAIGLTKFLLQLIFHSSSNSPRVDGVPMVAWGALADVPVVGPLLVNPFAWITAAVVVIAHVVLFRSRFGLRLRAAGENPAAAEAAGLDVGTLRYAGVLISGALAGLGGAWLGLDQHSFTDGMSGGRGFIALAAMIVGRWTPVGAMLACLLFASAETAQIMLQGGRVPAQFLQMLPYVATIVVLAGAVGRSTPPAAVGVVSRGDAL